MAANSRTSGTSVALGGFAAIFLAGLAALTVAVMHHRGTRLNTALLLGIHQHYVTGTGAGAALLSRVVAPEVVGVVALLIAVAAWLGKSHTEAVAIAVVAVGAAAFTEILKHVFRETRPHLFKWVMQAHGYSFPSGHTLMSTAIFPLLALLFSRLARSATVKAGIWILFLMAPFVIGLDRLYLGVHWPTDVLAGYLAGASFACAGLAWILSARNASPAERRTPHGDRAGA